MKKKLMILIAAVIAIAGFYVLYPKYYFMSAGLYVWRCNRITGTVELCEDPGEGWKKY